MSTNYVDLIKGFEAFSPIAYNDVSQNSIGFGTRTDDPAEISGEKQITEQEAEQRLIAMAEPVREFAKQLGTQNGLTWDDNELDALTSFGYNLGEDDLTKLISGRTKAEIAEAIPLYNKAGGKVLNGLVKRRQKEANLFTSGTLTGDVKLDALGKAFKLDSFAKTDEGTKLDSTPVTNLNELLSDAGKQKAAGVAEASELKKALLGATTKGKQGELSPSETRPIDLPWHRYIALDANPDASAWLANQRRLKAESKADPFKGADDSTTLGEDSFDTLSALSQGIVQGVLGTATGTGKLLSAGLLGSPDEKTYDPYGTGTTDQGYDKYGVKKGATSDFYTSLDKYADKGVNGIEAFKEFLGDELDSDAKKAQIARYAATSTAHQKTDEYKNASDIDKIKMDAQGTYNALLENDKVIAKIGIEGVADLLVSVVTGGFVAKQVTKGALKKGATAEAAKESGRKAASAAVTIHGSLSEGSSNAQGAVDEIRKMSHKDLMESEEYKAAYEELGSEEAAKDKIVNDVFQNVFVGTGLSSAAIGRITGADKAAAEVATGTVSKTVKKVADTNAGKAVLNASKEAIEETVQSGTGQIQSNLEVQKIDEDKELTEGVGATLVEGAVGGGIAGGSIHGVAAVKDAVKGTASAVSSGVGKLTPETPSNESAYDQASNAKPQDVASGKFKASTINPEVQAKEEQISEINSKLADKNLSSEETKTLKTEKATLQKELKAARKEGKGAPASIAEYQAALDNVNTYLNQEGLSDTERAEYTTLKTKLEGIVEAELASVKSDNESKANAYLQGEDTPENAQGAFKHIADPNTDYDSTLGNKLSGSTHLTSNQKAFVNQVVSSEGRHHGIVKKTMMEVASDVLEGAKGFMGLNQYISTLTNTIGSGDVNSTISTLKKLNGWIKQQEKKLAKEGNTDSFIAQVSDELEAMKLVYASFDDTAKQEFPDYKERAANLNKATSQSIKQQVSKSRSGNTRHTVSKGTRQNVVKHALSTLFNPAYKGAEGTEKRLANLRRKLNKSFNATSIKELNKAIRGIEEILSKKLLNRTKEEKAQLREYNTLVQDAYTQLLDGFDGNIDDLRVAMAEQSSQETTDEAFADKHAVTADLSEDIVIEQTEGHKALSTAKGDALTDVQEDTYKESIEKINQAIEEDAELLDAEELDGFQNLPSELNPLSDNPVDTYNKMVGIANFLEIKNTQVTVETGENKAESTTPNNRTFLNTLESLSPLSVIRNSFIYIGSKLGLLQTEEDLFIKLADKESQIYKFLTKNLSEQDKQDLDRVVPFMESMAKALDKTLVKDASKRNAKVKGKDVQANAIVYDFLTEQGIDSNIGAVIALAIADWAMTNGHGSLRLSDKHIGRILGIDKDLLDTFIPSHTERQQLEEAGISRSFMIQQIGSAIYRNLGFAEKDEALVEHKQQLITGLGELAIGAALNAGKQGFVKQQYAHLYDLDGKTESIVTDTYKQPSKDLLAERGLTKAKKLSSIPTIKAVESQANVEGEPIKLHSALENAINAVSNEHLMRDILGVETSKVPVYMEGETMPDHSQDTRSSSKQAEAVNKYQETKYYPVEGLWEIVESLPEEAQIALIDDIPESGTEHKDHTKRNEDLRTGALRELEGARNIFARMKETGSKYVRFISNIAHKNKRINQGGTDGNPQNSKIIRELFQFDPVELDPNNETHMLAFKLAITEALDVDSEVILNGEATGEYKGTDKSTDTAVLTSFDQVVTNDPIIQAAVEAIKAIRAGTSKDVSPILAALPTKGIKKGGATSGTMLRLTALYALAEWDGSTEPFKVHLTKENDGITNGIAFGLAQITGANSWEDYVDKLKKVGIYIGNRGDSNPDKRPLYTSFPQFNAEPQNDDAYVSFGKRMVEILLNPVSSPASKNRIYPSKNVTRSLFKTRFFPKAWLDEEIHSPTVDKADNKAKRAFYGEKYQEKGKTKRDVIITISPREYIDMARGIDFFLNYKNTRGMLDMVKEVSRNFAKNPLMIFNYGAAIKGLKKSVANQIVEGIRLSIEQANQIEDPEVRELKFKEIEQAVSELSFIPRYKWDDKTGKYSDTELYKWEINRDAPLETTVAGIVYDEAMVGVEFTYGHAMEKAFEAEYGVYRANVGKVIAMTKIMVAGYAQALDKRTAEILEGTGRTSLTIAEKRKLDAELADTKPMIAHALSENRLEDGIYIAKGENTPNRDEDGNPLDSGSHVKILMNLPEGQSMDSITYGNQVKDPSVSAGAVLTQALDAAVMYLGMLGDTEFVNIHDAKIFNLVNTLLGTQKTNKDFVDINQSYSYVAATLEALKSTLANDSIDKEELFKEIQKDVEGDFVGEHKTIDDMIYEFEAFAAMVKNNRDLLKEHSTVTNQYHYSDDSGHQHIGTNPDITEEEASARFQVELSLEEATAPSAYPESESVTRDSTIWSRILESFPNSVNIVEAIKTKIASIGSPTLVIFTSETQVENLLALEDVTDEAKRHIVQGRDSGAGVYHYNENVIYIYKYKLNTEQEIAETIFHELDHAATTHSVISDGISDKPSKEYLALVDIYRELMEEGFGSIGGLTIAQQMDMYEGIFGDFHALPEWNQAMGIAELLAWSKSNPALQRYLDSKNYKGLKGSLLDAVRYFAAKLLGIIKKDLSVYDAILGLSARYYESSNNRNRANFDLDALNAYNPDGYHAQEIKKRILASMASDMKKGKYFEASYYIKAMRKKLKNQFADETEEDELANWLEGLKNVRSGITRNHKINPSTGLLQYRSDNATNSAQTFTMDKANLHETFDSLDLGSVRASKAHQRHLSGILNKMAPTFESVKVKIMAANGEGMGAVENGGISLSINSGAKANNIEMSAQELMVHELMHLFIRGAKGTTQYKQMRKEYDIALANLTVDDFLTGIENPTEADYKAAEKRYNHTMYNNIQGYTKRETYLGEESLEYNADPVEEFAVMALTNEPVMKALSNMQRRLPETESKLSDKIIAWFEAILALLNDKVKGLSNLSTDKRMLRLAEHLMGMQNQNKSMIYRASTKIGNGLDATDEFLREAVNKHVINFQGLKFLYDVELKDNLRNMVNSNSLMANNITRAIFTEFTIGRKGLEALVRLLSKSTYLIERKSQQLVEFVAEELEDVFKDLTEKENETIYTGLLEADVQSLLAHYSLDEIKRILTDKAFRNTEVNRLKGELQGLSPSGHIFMSKHAEDLGYHLVTGARLYAQGQYINAEQIAYQYGSPKRVAVSDETQAMFLLEALATIHAVDFNESINNSDIGSMVQSGRIDDVQLESLLNLHRETTNVAAETSFEHSTYNMRKGYLREEFDVDSDVTIGTAADHDRLVSVGYVKQEPVKQDKTVGKQGQAYYYVKQGGSLDKYLTGVMSLANTNVRGTDLFPEINQGTELDKMQIEADLAELVNKKLKAQYDMYNGKAKVLPLKERGAVAQPRLDSNGDVIGYRYIMTDAMKDEMRGRKKDFKRSIGFTLAGVSRKAETTKINAELIAYMHKTYVQEYEKYPNEFMIISPKHNKETWNLLPDDAKHEARRLWGASGIAVRKEQMDIAFGYRKFSVGQLRYRHEPVDGVVANITKVLNNLASVAFNNKFGVTVEEYMQAFVKTAKDTIVIKTGVVTAANIASNVVLLWLSGVPLSDILKDHIEAYKATFKYNKTNEELFKINVRLASSNLSENAKAKLIGRRNVLRQDLYNNPVRDLIEAGVYQTIVSDIDITDTKTAARDVVEEKLEPITTHIPDVIKVPAKTLLMTHDSSIYKFMRDMAQISDFAARYSLHKNNMKKGKAYSDSIRDITHTFINYDVPTHKGVQYLNDMGVLGFTKYLFRIQQVLIKRIGSNPTRVMITQALQMLFGMNVPDPYDGALTISRILRRFFTPTDWFNALDKNMFIEIASVAR